MVADEFLYIADVLAPLRRNEILFLGALHRCYTQVRGERPEAHLEGDRFTFGREATQLLKIALIPPVFPDWITLEAVGASLTRTGFVKEATVESAPVFLPTPLLSGLVSLINIEAACAAEGQKKP
ncbi:hypothetical protein [Cupriavidus plantarum]|uniref:Uncharacterized protein n=1 Tax=Cupriavidus plantarum TaxID=942865 RepID=A0A316ESD6_9BURK|nr:hypothetical protein [Cupriavidus plantarum]PWK33468.1 hypothetical protein C7419_104143 [Cupriavidus plantarum]